MHRIAVLSDKLLFLTVDFNRWRRKNMLIKNFFVMITLSLLILLSGCNNEFVGDEITLVLIQRLLPEFSPIFPPETEFVYLREIYVRALYIVLLKGTSPYHNIAEIYQSFGFVDDDFTDTHNYVKLVEDFPPHWDPHSLEHFQSAMLEAGTKDGKTAVLAFTYEDERASDTIRFYIEYSVITDSLPTE